MKSRTEEVIKEAFVGVAIVLAVVAFYFFVYNPAKDSFFIEALFIFYGSAIFPLGIYLIRKKMAWKKDRQIKALFAIFLLFIALDIVASAVGIAKFGLKREVVVALSFFHDWLSPLPFSLTFCIGYAMALAFALPAVAVTVWLFKKYAKYFWLAVFSLWLVSALKLLLG